ncbi:hypothetical protein L7F22_033719 [Adiantum nelumboides]|nr:hypothetical protein [Adiantum nelumboides]
MESQAATVNAQAREAFKSGCTRPFEWRLRQLNAVARLLQECEADIGHAVHQDLGKSPFETFATETGAILNSCDLMRSNLKKWMKPRKVSLQLAVQPASASIVAEPLGVVLIFSAWNFPLLLALDPLIGAIGAGNAVVLKPSDIAPAVASLLAKLIPMYMDTEAVKVVEGGVPASEKLLEQRWDKIFFTDSWIDDLHPKDAWYQCPWSLEYPSDTYPLGKEESFKAAHEQGKSMEASSQRPPRQPAVQSPLARPPTQTPTRPPASKATSNRACKQKRKKRG